MSEFDPSQRCWVHEQLNRKSFAWPPERAADFTRLSANSHIDPEGRINYGGLLFDGWWPWEERPSGVVEGWPWPS